MSHLCMSRFLGKSKPCAPVAPDKPVDPVRPLRPVSPVAPVRPDDPVRPLRPVCPELPARQLPTCEAECCHCRRVCCIESEKFMSHLCMSRLLRRSKHWAPQVRSACFSSTISTCIDGTSTFALYAAYSSASKQSASHVGGCLAGNSGQTGLSGLTGSSGLTGAMGETGLSGLTGSTGLSGAIGAQCLLLLNNLDMHRWDLNFCSLCSIFFCNDSNQPHMLMAVSQATLGRQVSAASQDHLA